jgi:hypothetical protein
MEPTTRVIRNYILLVLMGIINTKSLLPTAGRGRQKLPAQRRVCEPGGKKEIGRPSFFLRA